MKNVKKLVAMLLVLVMVAALFAGCKPTEPATTTEPKTEPVASNDTTPIDTPAPTDEPVVTEPPVGEPSNTLVVATADFSSKFTPFFYTTVYDGYIGSAMTQVALLGTDREGNVVLKGIEGETRAYNGKDYTYYGIADCDITENDDGTVDYKITIRDDIKFSDGEPLTMDDVLFSIYMLCDPTYDGSSTFYALPIEGMKEYRSGMTAKSALIFEGGPEGESEYYTAEERDTWWAAAEQAKEDFVNGIVSYCSARGYGDTVADALAAWGFGGLDADATAMDGWEYMLAEYDGDIATMIGVEAGDVDFMEAVKSHMTEDEVVAFDTGVKTGDGADNISGITKLSDTELNIHMTEVDATAIYHIGVTVAPLHYYGDPALFDYDNNMFGFNKGDMSLAKAKSTQPLGAGPYTFESYADATVTMKANPNYYKGCPKTEYILFKETSSADMLTGISTGTYDLTADATYNVKSAETIRGYNSNGETTGDVYTTVSIDNLGYGYIGINADLVKVGDDSGSEASRNLRKAFATLFAVYRDTVIDSYYGELAQVINYPISNTSWAAPKPADEGYEIAFSKDVDGNPIYTEGMTEEEKYAAALEAAKGFFKAAGFEEDANGNIVGVEEYTAVIPADGTGDHPAYKILTNTKEALESIGVKFDVYDVADGNILWDGLDANTIAIWAAAWGASVDPDMYQVYHSDNITGHGTGSNHYMITSDVLDGLIMDARASVDQAYRKATYKECLNEILDWAVEIPTYQRQNASLFSTQRVNMDTVTPDITTFWDWMNDIELLEMNPA